MKQHQKIEKNDHWPSPSPSLYIVAIKFRGFRKQEKKKLQEFVEKGSNCPLQVGLPYKGLCDAAPLAMHHPLETYSDLVVDKQQWTWCIISYRPLVFVFLFSIL
jgi:hypothetical protein